MSEPRAVYEAILASAPTAIDEQVLAIREQESRVREMAKRVRDLQAWGVRMRSTFRQMTIEEAR